MTIERLKEPTAALVERMLDTSWLLTPTPGAAHALRVARDLLAEPEGWNKGCWVARGGELCPTNPPEGSLDLNSALGPRTSRDVSPRDAVRAYHAVSSLLDDRYRHESTQAGDPDRFNGALETTHADVLAVLDRAIDVAEAAIEQGGYRT